ncbi:MAG: NADP-dependent isocitrate dehydrogenase, partial [Actinomycetota bacterium]|nr:NADP-dependent isocitrate dehydrogenase [Actinomycetota bacterium]
QLFEPLANELSAAQETILQDLLDCQGQPMDIGGYYFPDPELASSSMRPSPTFNSIIAQFG